MANIDVKDFTTSSAATVKTRLTSSVNTPIHQLEDSAGGEVMGTTTDAAVTAGATGSQSAKLRSISRDIGTINTVLGSTAWDLGTGTGGSRTQRVAMDTSQVPAVGSAVSASSIPVVIASDQGAVAVKGSGTAGTANSGVVSVQGIASMTPLLVNGSGVTQPVSGTVTANAGSGTLAVSNTLLTNLGVGEYETVAASATTQALGATGAAGDYLAAIIIVPGTAAAGNVTIKDGSNAAITVFVGGGTTALPTLAPIRLDLGMISTNGAWQVSTGTNVTVIGIGNFT